MKTHKDRELMGLPELQKQINLSLRLYPDNKNPGILLNQAFINLFNPQQNTKR